MLPFAQDAIDYPTTADVVPWLPTMVEDVVVAATRFFEGVGQYRQAFPRSVVVDAVRQRDHRPVIPRQPVRVDGDPSEGVAENAADEVALNIPCRPTSVITEYVNDEHMCMLSRGRGHC
jgi:hypothetical protein